MAASTTAGQIGSEATPADFVAALIECTREWLRVLKPTGSLWVNLGDKYSGSGKGGAPSKSSTLAGNGHIGGGPKLRSLADAGASKPVGAPQKSLLGLPWRYALRLHRRSRPDPAGRGDLDKPNGLPESVTDRVRRSHEQWFHFVKQPRYFSAVDEIREPHRDPRADKAMSWEDRKARGDAMRQGEQSGTFGAGIAASPLGKLPGSVWEIASQPLTVPKDLGIDHFAAFPMEWPRRIVLGWSPPGICVECGQGRRPVIEKEGESTYAKLGKLHAQNKDVTRYKDEWNTVTANGSVPHFESRQARIAGYACACSEPTAPTRPAVVLDPFSGTGTTALVASVLGRRGIGVDMSADYCRLAQWRTTDPKQLARAARPARSLDRPLDTSIGSAAMTTDTTSADVKAIQDRNATGRGAVIAAANLAAANSIDPSQDTAAMVEAAFMALADHWIAEADLVAAAKKKGHVTLAKELRDAASRVRGFAVGLTTRPSTMPPAPACEHDAEHRSLRKDGSILCTHCQTVIDVPGNLDEVVAALPTDDPVRDAFATYLDPSILTEVPGQPGEHFEWTPPTDPAARFEAIATTTGDDLFTSPASEEQNLRDIIGPLGASPQSVVDPSPFTSPSVPWLNRRPVASLSWPAVYEASKQLASSHDRRDHVSHSYVEGYESCSLSSMLRDASKHNLIGAQRPSWSQIGGSAFHAVVAQIEMHALAGVELVADWEEYFEAAVKAQMEALAGTPYADHATWYVSNKGKEGYDWWRVEGAKMLDLYTKHHNSDYRSKVATFKIFDTTPVIEYPYEMTVRSLDGGTGITAKGFIDIARLDLATFVLTVCDYKTGARDPLSTFQLGEYAHALLSTMGIAHEPQDRPVMGSYWLARKGIYTTPVKVIQAHPLAELQYRYDAAQRGTKANVFAPHVTNMCKSCSVRDYCPTQAQS